jgi:hypothetical protein
MVTRRLDGRLGLVAHYVGLCLPMFLAWEFAQLPLYTIWEEQGVRASLTAALHCTAGDVAYSILAFGSALIVAAYARRLRGALAVATTTLLLGLVVTMVVEVVSTRWLGRWRYGPLMPVDPVFGVGVSPLAQWTVVPAAALLLLRRRLVAACAVQH